MTITMRPLPLEEVNSRLKVLWENYGEVSSVEAKNSSGKTTKDKAGALPPAV